MLEHLNNSITMLEHLNNTFMNASCRSLLKLLTMQYFHILIMKYLHNSLKEKVFLNYFYIILLPTFMK